MISLLRTILLLFWSATHSSAESSLRGLQQGLGFTNGISPLPLIACDNTRDCTPINCFIPPCDENKCIDGWCTLVPAVRNDDNSANNTDTVADDGGEPCGATTCDVTQVCCNESCGICTEVGGVCISQYCDPDNENNNGTVGEDDGQDEEDDGDDNEDQPDGTWISVTRGNCNCQGLCSVCQETIFGVCLTMFCSP
jgi:hypothetical protein